ncbi:hypothetical protein EVB27_114 [Rhizobium phage RHph_TM16]|nr:hypothetical protein EVB27_114 [Rhizobium phage RHph_TM16]
MKLIFKPRVTPAPPPPPQTASEEVRATNLDDLARSDIKKSQNLLVPWYLMASYLYYVRDVSILSDGMYDRICFELDENYSRIEHWHKSYIDRKQLKAGTGYKLQWGKMPVRIISAANLLAKASLGIPYPTAAPELPRMAPEPEPPKPSSSVPSKRLVRFSSLRQSSPK